MTPKGTENEKKKTCRNGYSNHRPPARTAVFLTTVPPVLADSTSYFANVTNVNQYLIKNSQAVKKGAAPKKAMVKKDVKSKVAAKKWL